MAISNVLTISKQGLNSNQGALAVVSHNIANVNTPGFSRQTAVLQPTTLAQRAEKTVGTGVQIDVVVRKVDDLIEKRYRSGQGELGRLQARERFLPMVEEVFNEMDEEGLMRYYDEFFKAVDNLADNPSNPVIRSEVVTKAEGLTNHINGMRSALDEMGLPLDQELTVTLDDLNLLLKNLGEVNRAIIRQENSNQPALDLKDQRTKMLNDLATLIDTQVLDEPGGGVTVLTGSGALLLNAGYEAQFSRGAVQSSTGFASILVSGKGYDISSQIQSGQLRGILELRDEVLNGSSGFLGRLNTWIDEMRFQVNVVHSQSVGTTLANQQIGFTLPQVNGSDNNWSSILANRLQDGDITLAAQDATGAFQTETLNLVAGNITSLEDLRDAINASALNNIVTASIQPGVIAGSETPRRLVIDVNAAGGFQRFGVLSDDTGALAATGVGGLFTWEQDGGIGVNAQIQADHDRVSGGQLINTAGVITHDDVNNEGALALGEVRSKKFALFANTPYAHTASFSAHYAMLVGDLGSEVGRNTEGLLSQETTQSFMADVRESVSGVSLEEELTNLMKFQRAFQASSRSVNVADELLQTLLNML
jgi:flagellar hook-associated protein 1 FlgK